MLWLVLAISSLVAAPADETALLALWQIHTNNFSRPARVTEACRQFTMAHPQSALVVVGHGLNAWHLLRSGQTNEAAVILEGLLSASDDPLPRAGAELARSWLTRLDRERVRAALRVAYADQIAYPAAFPASTQPETDRWGKRWDYRLTKTRFVKAVTAQTYELRSPTLGAGSDLGEALAIPYGSRIGLRPVGREGGAVTFSVSGRAESVALSPGTEFGGTAFVYLGETVVVLSDGNHWAVIGN